MYIALKRQYHEPVIEVYWSARHADSNFCGAKTNLYRIKAGRKDRTLLIIPPPFLPPPPFCDRSLIETEF